MDLAAELERQAAAKRDLIVPAKKMHASTLPSVQFRLVIDDAGGEVRYPLDDFVCGQLAKKLDIPLSYFKRMREYHQEFDGTIGVRRMTIELNEKADQPINRKRVERLMRTHNIVGVNLCKPKKTTVKDQGARVVDDFLKRKFRAEAPNQVYVGNITYLPCGQGQFLYLATVIDVCSRRLVGWSIADHIRTSLVEDALENAARARGSLAGAVFHSDHGRQ